MHLQLKVRDEKLGVASDLQKFLQNLDHFQQWLTRTETAIASEDIPNELVEAEQLLHDHALIKQEIDTYAPDYAQMKEYGQEVVEGQEGVQYMFLREVGAVGSMWKLTWGVAKVIAVYNDAFNCLTSAYKQNKNNDYIRKLWKDWLVVFFRILLHLHCISFSDAKITLKYTMLYTYYF